MISFYSKRGFTLVELLVVIGIIGVLIALLLPATCCTRESSRRMHCSNNLKQIAISMHNYHDTFSGLPSGWIQAEDANGIATNQPAWSWAVSILPFSECSELYEELNAADHGLNMTLVNEPVSYQQFLMQDEDMFHCPSDYRSVPYVTEERTINNIAVGYSNYMGVAGHRTNTAGVTNNSGVFYRNSQLTFNNITDGLSNTVMIGERTTKNCNSGSWVGLQNSGDANGEGADHKQGMWMIIGASRAVLNQPDPPIHWNDDRGCGRGFSSEHPGGAQFAYCDGSVSFITNDIEFNWAGDGEEDHRDSSNGAYQKLFSRNEEVHSETPTMHSGCN